MINVIKNDELGADFSVLLTHGETQLASCTVWIKNAPCGPDGAPSAAIGKFDADSFDHAKQVLDRACEIIREHGISSAVGPMDGNTWRRYRFVTYSNGSEPFILELTNPPEYPGYFEGAGFSPVSQYFSKRSVLADKYDKTHLYKAELEKRGITFRTLRADELDKDLDIIYDISHIAFKDNLYYTELDRESFKKQYYAYKDYLVPQYILIASDNGKPAGFVFCIPDYNEMKTGGHIETLVAKTIAVMPEYRKMHLGSAMLNTAYEHAYQDGLRSAVIALVYSGNVSANLIEDGSSYVRKYTLYKKEL